MRKSSLLVATVCAALSVSALASSADAFTTNELKCRSTVFKASGKLSKSMFGFFDDCHDGRSAGTVDPLRPCNSLDYADLDNKYLDVSRKFRETIMDQCANESTASMFFETCPAPCEGLSPPTDANLLRHCLECLVRESSEATSDEAAGSPTPPLGSTEAACHASVTRADGKLFASVLKRIGNCQKKIDKSYPGDVTTCLGVHFPGQIATDTASCVAKLSDECSGVTLPSATLDACGGAATVAELSDCVCQEARDNALELAGHFIEMDAPDPPTTTTVTTTTIEPTTTTTNTLPESDPDCPDVAELVLFSRDSATSCTTNTDCQAPRTCSTATGICSTSTDIDTGWVGLAHDNDTNDGDLVRTRIYCAGPGPVCGQCDVLALDAQAGSCRCQNDQRTVCDHQAAHDSTACGGAACQCYLGAPTPVSNGGTPLCNVERLSGPITGSINVDSGALDLDVPLSLRVFLGEATSRPCPVCAGKCSDDSSVCSSNDDCGAGPTCQFDTPNDGTRDGLCIGGESDGLACDANSRNASFPAIPGANGGGLYSLDCMPSPGRNVSGSGLAVDFDESTAGNSLSAALDCGGQGVGLDCPCKACSVDGSVACDSDSDCAGQGGRCSGANVACSSDPDCSSANLGTCTAIGNTRCSLALSVQCHGNNSECHNVNVGTCQPSTCSSNGIGDFPLPNNCQDLECSSLGDGNGQCASGPDAAFCNGLVEANGSGIIACAANSDCAPDMIGVDAGDCTLSIRNPCFLDPIVAGGSADPHFPVTAAVTCVPPTSSAGINAVHGLPGPLRRITQRGLRTLCASDHGTAYTPGSGLCP